MSRSPLKIHFSPSLVYTSLAPSSVVNAQSPPEGDPLNKVNVIESRTPQKCGTVITVNNRIKHHPTGTCLVDSPR